MPSPPSPHINLSRWLISRGGLQQIQHRCSSTLPCPCLLLAGPRKLSQTSPRSLSNSAHVGGGWYRRSICQHDPRPPHMRVTTQSITLSATLFTCHTRCLDRSSLLMLLWHNNGLLRDLSSSREDSLYQHDNTWSLSTPDVLTPASAAV